MIKVEVGKVAKKHGKWVRKVAKSNEKQVGKVEKLMYNRVGKFGQNMNDSDIAIIINDLKNRNTKIDIETIDMINKLRVKII